MKRRILGTCPVCDARLYVTTLTCKECSTSINGEFSLSKFDYLPSELQDFALIFLKNAGNIKAIEREMNISYPTVKKYLDEVIKGLGFNNVDYEAPPLTRTDILKMLKNGEIDFAEAEEMLKKIGEE